ncbi:RNA polymerase sigma factor, sigma-70 family [Paenibacillus sp. UNCCL117]|uniref:RNA polymerase sigma factor n=1 Tax=unclassified Paenibacillus TaxID=185978 RepID=UPI000888AA73|nr:MULTISPECIES: sigma-70 family RNA polymerase sigma factor [unclassified Paenibacillus]SDE32712.1 RNA polymerase sigma factor, sigma-70 family [Paenibacillus sp. cl123]SFW63847.1 RNA polymerase sigma factor, sigma-70 family [Paenibacillus sp. UNCCL117]
MIAGDRDAFNELVSRYGRYLYQTVYGVLRSAKDAEDATQEALISIFAALPQYRYQGFKSWMTRIAVNKAIDYKRSRERKKEQLTAEWGELEPVAAARVHTVEEAVLDREKREQLRGYVDQLPEHYRQVVYAFYMEEKSYQQIAQEQQIALKTVESKLYRAKQHLRKAWKEEDRE